jgi:hypothetical protein
MAVARSIDWIEERRFPVAGLFGIAELLSVV